MNFFFVLIFLGLIASFYALSVNLRMKNDKKYKPLCDLNNKISCSKAFKSDKGRIFGLPNPVYGIIFYSFIVFLHTSGMFLIVKVAIIISVIASFYLAYVLFFRIRTICVVCISIYAINVLLLINYL